MGHKETEWGTPNCMGRISLLVYPDNANTHYTKPLFYALVVFIG